MRNLLLANALAMPCLASAALAQTAESAESDGDIVVTATRTESLLSKTPLAVTAIKGDDLARAGISNPTQLDTAVPNLAITRYNGLQITIRGVTSADNTEKGDPSAAFMLNGIYIARPQAQEVSFFDIDRVEVLRGPQGTLYGRNSTAGVVNVLTTRPKSTFGGSFDVSYGSYNTINANGVLNIPVGSTLAVRAAASLDRRDSFMVDGAPGDGVSFDPYKDNISGRLSALWNPTSQLSVYVVGDYSRIRGVPMGAVAPENFYSNIVTGARSTFDAPTYLQRARDDYLSLGFTMPQRGQRRSHNTGVEGEIEYDFGPAKLTYLGSYRKFKMDEYSNIVVASFFAIPSRNFGDFRQTSHELRASLTGSGPLQMQVGGYYFREESDIYLALYNLVGPNTAFQFLRNPTISKNTSVFGQASYTIVPHLKLTLGARYSHDTKSRYGSTVIDSYSNLVDAYNLGTFLNRFTTEVTAAKRSFSKTTWRAGIDYDSPLGLVFASVATGYKAGGFNDGCEAGTGPGCSQSVSALYYNPETLTAYEAGFKFKFGPQFRLNGTVFHYDYAGLQLTQSVNICGPNGNLPCSVTRNAAASKVDGVELDAELRPSNRLTVRLAANYLDAHYDSFVPESGVNLSGRPLDRSPKWTWAVGANYTVPVGEGRLVASAQTRFSSRYELDTSKNGPFTV